MAENLNWELVQNDYDHDTWRAEIFGGWLVRHHEFRDLHEGEELFGLTFVPDPTKEWKIGNV